MPRTRPPRKSSNRNRGQFNRQSVPLRFSRATVCAIVLSALAVIASACGTSTENTGAKSSAVSRYSLTMTEYAGTMYALPQVVAQDQGFFKTNHLRVTQVVAKNGPIAISALESGSAQVIGTTFDHALLVDSKGGSMVEIVNENPNPELVVLVKKGIPTPHQSDGYPKALVDLKGLRVGVPALGGIVYDEAKTMLAGAGLSPSSVTLVAVGASTAAAALESGSVQAVFTYEPNVTRLLYANAAKIIVDTRNGSGPPQFHNWSEQALFADRSFAKAHPVEISDVRKAITQAIEWMKKPSNHSQLIKIVESLLNLNSTEAANFIKSNINGYGYAASCTMVNSVRSYMISNNLAKSSALPTCSAFLFGAQ